MIRKGRDFGGQSYFWRRVGKTKPPTGLLAAENERRATARAREQRAGCREPPGDTAREPSIVPPQGTRYGA